MSSTPTWEVPFIDVWHVIEAVPHALGVASTVAGDVSQQLPKVAAEFVSLIGDATIAITDKGLNIAVDAAVAQDFLAALKSLQSLLGMAGAAVAASSAAPAA